MPDEVTVGKWTIRGDGSWTRADDPGEPVLGTPRVSVAPDELSILARYAREKRVLEIGTGLGVSTEILGSVGQSIWSIDIDPWVLEVVAPRIREILPQWVSVVITDRWPGEDVRFDLIFIDGDHSVDGVRKDTVEAVKRLAPGGLVIWHDWNSEAVRHGALTALPGDAKILERKTTHGLGIYHG